MQAYEFQRHTTLFLVYSENGKIKNAENYFIQKGFHTFRYDKAFFNPIKTNLEMLLYCP